MGILPMPHFSSKLTGFSGTPVLPAFFHLATDQLKNAQCKKAASFKAAFFIESMRFVERGSVIPSQLRLLRNDVLVGLVGRDHRQHVLGVRRHHVEDVRFL